MQPFLSAEEAYFWTVEIEKMKLDGAQLRSGYQKIERPCSSIDIVKVIQNLCEQRKLNIQHMLTLRFFGLRGMVPDPTVYGRKYDGRDERIAHKLWTEAMGLIEEVLIRKGIVAKPEGFRVTAAGLKALEEYDNHHNPKRVAA